MKAEVILMSKALKKMFEKIEWMRKNPPLHLAQPKKYECTKCKDTGFLYRIDENGHSVARRCECSVISQMRDMMKIGRASCRERVFITV